MNNKDIQFMPFGSMMNSYGLINQGSKKSTDDFLKDVDAIYKKSLALTNQKVSDTQQSTMSYKQPSPPSEEVMFPL